MNTQTHLLIGAAFFGGKVPRLAWAGAIGGILPDIPMFLIVAALKAYGVHNLVIFGFLYWQNWWQIANAISHNFWLWGGLLVFSIAMRERRNLDLNAIDRWMIPIVLSASALLHTSIDFLCHREDAHMSLWPLTRWKFISPVSYWDQNHFGFEFSVFETGIGLVLAGLLFARFSGLLVRAALLMLIALYVAAPLYWSLSFS